MKRGNSKATTRTPRTAHYSKAFQFYGHNARVKTAASTNVRLASVDRGDHFPYVRSDPRRLQDRSARPWPQIPSIREVRRKPFHHAPPLGGLRTTLVEIVLHAREAKALALGWHQGECRTDTPCDLRENARM